MIFQTLPGLAIRQAERASSMSHMELPDIYQGFGPADSLGIPGHVVQRLPPISNLLRDVPPPPAHPQHYATFLPSPLPSPIGPSPALSSNPYPTWSALPPRPRSVPGQHPGFLPPPPSVVPRRASTDYTGTGTGSTMIRSLSVPSQRPIHHYQHSATPGRDRDHRRSQRRSTKQHARRRRESGSEASTPFSGSSSSSGSSSGSDSDSPPGPPPSRRRSRSNNNNSRNRNETQTQPQTSPPFLKPRKKRNNTQYTPQQEAFFIYHRIDLEQSWEQVRAAYMARWPGLERSVSGLECAYYRTNGHLPVLECAYYRTNGHLPVLTADGLMVLVDPALGPGQGQGQRGLETPPGTPLGVDGGNGNGGSSSGWGGGIGDEGDDYDDGGDVEGGNTMDDKKKIWYMYYKGVAYRTQQVMCRVARMSLMERFPEELVDEANDWVREEHRVMARGIAERRRLQREAFLAAKARQNQERTVYF